MVYSVRYRLWFGAETKRIDVIDKNKADAWDKAVFVKIPNKEGEIPYSAWVESVTYQNGNYRVFNTSEGLPY